MAFCWIRTTSCWWILMLTMGLGWILTGSGSSQTRVPVGSLTKEDPCKRLWSFFFDSFHSCRLLCPIRRWRYTSHVVAYTILNDLTETGSKETTASGGVHNKQLKNSKMTNSSPGILSQWLDSHFWRPGPWRDAQISQAHEGSSKNCSHWTASNKSALSNCWLKGW